jgi:hypothetical protein
MFAYFAQLDSVIADHHILLSPGSAALMAFWMDSPGPTTELSAVAEPTPIARATPLVTNRVRAIVLNKSSVRLMRIPLRVTFAP